jgi:hypothetical protein
MRLDVHIHSEILFVLHFVTIVRLTDISKEFAATFFRFDAAENNLGDFM